jgi:hypothetical protein
MNIKVANLSILGVKLATPFEKLAAYCIIYINAKGTLSHF